MNTRTLSLIIVLVLAGLSTWWLLSEEPSRTVSRSAMPVLPEGDFEMPDILPEHAAGVHTDDLPAMLERRVVRALVTPSLTDFFSVEGELRGLQVELLRDLEADLNAGRPRSEPEVHVVFIPVPFSELMPSLLEGRGDIAAAILTRTAERAEQVDLVGGIQLTIDEVLVQHGDVEGIGSVDDLAGRSLYVLRSSSYLTHLQELNDGFRVRGLEPMELIPADPYLSTEDILELVNAGLVELTVADDYKAGLWADVLPDIRVREDIKIFEGARAGWAVRKSNPQLARAIRAANEDVRQGTLLGNIFLKRYFESTQWVDDPTAREERERFAEYASLFREYGERYEFDWLALVAQAYQESGLDHSVESPAGAVGIMQLLPSTAADPKVDIPDISELEDNIHAGAKYMAFLRGRYFSDEERYSPTDQLAFTWASYNAGPRKVMRMQDRAEELGLDPDRWFGHVEYAALDLVGTETTRYVANIYKYYVAYRLSQELLRERERALESAS